MSMFRGERKQQLTEGRRIDGGGVQKDFHLASLENMSPLTLLKSTPRLVGEAGELKEDERDGSLGKFPQLSPAGF